MRTPTTVLAVIISLAVPDAGSAQETIAANQNRTSAGRVSGSVLTVQLEAREGRWHPQAEDGGSILVRAFGEAGKPLQIPGPMLRVRAGTKLHVSVRNTFDAPLVFFGLHRRPGDAMDTVHVGAQSVRTITFDAGEPGTYYYWATTTATDMELRDGGDSQLNGAFVVDPADGPIEADRIFILGLWAGTIKRDSKNVDGEIMVINGKSWPDTERLTFTAGDNVRWRWINPTNSSHPMHLHGFYFTVDGRGDWARRQTVPEAQRQQIATELMLPGAAMDMRWTAEREGNWIFHCHFAFHVSTELLLAPASHAMHTEHSGGASKAGAAHAMAGLVLGMHVLPNPSLIATKSSASARRIRLLAQARVDTTMPAPRLGYAMHAGGAEPHPDSLAGVGPLLVLRRNQPVAVTVVNRLKEPTAVHWHGIELESFPDGVPGWSGTPARIMPSIAPADSFVAEFVPPRSGTFIYHTHSNELEQMFSGLVGPLVVLDDAETLPANERIFLVSGAIAPNGELVGLVNGQFEPAGMRLEAGRTYKFRFINIGDWRVFFSLLDAAGYPTTRMVAKDGADLTNPITGPLNLLTGPGETADFEIALKPGRYRLEIKQQLRGWIVPVELTVH